MSARKPRRYLRFFVNSRSKGDDSSNSLPRKVDVEQPDNIDDQLASSEATTGNSQRKHGNVLQTAFQQFEDYCAYSTIHGVRYFAEKKRHWMERCWWIIGFAISWLCCGWLIYQIYSKWNHNSVIVSIAEELTPVWHIPFPAVTICPTTKVKTTQLNIGEALEKVFDRKRTTFNFSDRELKLLNAVSQICKPHICERWDSLGLGDNVTGGSIVELLKEIAPRLNETIYECYFLNYDQEFCTLFEEIMTDEGLCFTFNMLNGNETYTNDISPEYPQVRHNRTSYWNIERGYNSNLETESLTYPYRVAGSGADGHSLWLWLELSANNFENLCQGPAQGYTIVLHIPGEIPQVSKYYFRIPLMQEVSVSVKASIMKTSEGLRRYQPHRRKCYFDGERKLRFLKVYTQRNCELECLSNATLNSCGCVKFSMPRDASSPICGSKSIRCYHSVQENLLKTNITATRLRRPCNCLPACHSITYDAEISQNPFDWNSYSKTLNYSKNDFDEYKPTRLEIFFKENEFITLKRSELYGPTDFVANFGGLVGLFMGASFISIVELLYFCTLRLYCNIRERAIRKGRRADSANECKY